MDAWNLQDVRGSGGPEQLLLSSLAQAMGVCWEPPTLFLSPVPPAWLGFSDQ